MTFQIVHEPDKDSLPYCVYELNDLKAVRKWRQSFATEAEAHRWVKANNAMGGK